MEYEDKRVTREEWKQIKPSKIYKRHVPIYIDAGSQVSSTG